MDNVSFKGIKNLYINHNISTKIGAYVDNAGQIKAGNKKYLSMQFLCRLTDDAEGADLTNFKTALRECKDSFQANCVARNDSNNINLTVNRCFFEDNLGAGSNSNFTLNGIAIAPNDRKVLPLFTFLAALTRKIKFNSKNPIEYQKLANEANLSISEEAMRFIENM